MLSDTYEFKTILSWHPPVCQYMPKTTIKIKIDGLVWLALIVLIVVLFWWF